MVRFDQYGNMLGVIPAECARDCSAPGSVDDAVAHWRAKLDFVVPRDMAISYLAEFGAWTHDELCAKSDNELAETVLWTAACDIKENGEWYGVCH